MRMLQVLVVGGGEGETRGGGELYPCRAVFRKVGHRKWDTKKKEPCASTFENFFVLNFSKVNKMSLISQNTIMPRWLTSLHCAPVGRVGFECSPIS